MYRVLTTISFLLSVFFIGNAAYANVTLPAGSCQVLSGTASRDEYGKISNTSSSTDLKIQCPIPTDPCDYPFDGDVWVIDKSSSKSVSCTVYEYNPIGGRYTGLTLSTSTTGYSTSTQHLANFTAPSCNGTFSNRYFICTIPPVSVGQSSVVGYLIVTP